MWHRTFRRHPRCSPSWLVEFGLCPRHSTGQLRQTLLQPKYSPVLLILGASLSVLRPSSRNDCPQLSQLLSPSGLRGPGSLRTIRHFWKVNISSASSSHLMEIVYL